MGHLFSKTIVREIAFPFIKFYEATDWGSIWYQVKRIDQENFEKCFAPGTSVSLNLEESEGDYGYCFSKDKNGNEISLFMFGVDEDTVDAVKKLLEYKKCYNQLKDQMLLLASEDVSFNVQRRINSICEMLDNQLKGETNHVA